MTEETISIKRTRAGTAKWDRIGVSASGIRLLQKRARAAAEAEGLTQDTIAARAGCSQKTVSAFFSHQTRYCRVQTVVRILRAVGFEVGCR